MKLESFRVFAHFRIGSSHAWNSTDV